MEEPGVIFAGMFAVLSGIEQFYKDSRMFEEFTDRTRNEMQEEPGKTLASMQGSSINNVHINESRRSVRFLTRYTNYVQCKYHKGRV